MQFAFVTYGGDDKQTPADRSQVRSHCMKGRNKREGSRRSNREARRAAKQFSTNVEMSAVPVIKCRSSLAISQGGNASISTTVPRRVKQRSAPPDEGPWDRLPQAPRGFVFGPVVDEFANAVGQMPESLMRQFMAFNRITEASYPLVEIAVDFNDDVGFGSIWPSFDKSFLHTILFINSAVNDWAQNLPLAKSSQFHLGRTLTLLNKKLATGASHLDDTTIYTVMLLAIVSSTSGDYDASNAHMAGLQRLVEMRGSHGYLWVNPVTQFKLECLDLMWCLTAGGAPLFLKGPVSWDPAFTRPSPSVDVELYLALSQAFMDPRLIIAFQDLQRLTELINVHADSNMRLNASEFQPVLSSIQTRLLHLKNLLVDMPGEWLCLGMLAFLATMFRVPGRQVAYKHLADRLRRACRTLVPSASSPISQSMSAPSTNSGLRSILRWLAIVCGATVFGTSERWLQELWDSIAEPNLLWAETRTELKQVMWIGCIQDERGRRIFAALELSR
ncbi:Protein of unknown function DUF3468 [Penicillium concentricum]|uniref:Transcription factor domain-containing protein n=1 Tax=Penicillium concentricum TaxID=293559 RepID=A0A9W9SC43_9EURO|nr:Protein of unknown function DUF3468 [Penicillium concentricum]KAJ5373423.1 Protein of unknown function DUF3468 [Penicillium concentricum]